MTSPDYVQGPFDRNHLLLAWGGSLPGGEVWSCSVKLADGRAASPAALNDAFLATVNTQDWVDGFIKDAVLGYHTRFATQISGNCKLQWCKLNLVGREGLYVEEYTAQHVFPDTAGAGSAGSGGPPNQVALAVSLTTGVSRGPAHRGRFFLPMPVMVPDAATGLCDVSLCNGVATSTKTFLEAISDVPGLDLPSSPGAVVMSRKAGAPRTRQVTGVEIGRVLDTQRRRRNKLAENYRVAAVDQGLA